MSCCNRCFFKDVDELIKIPADRFYKKPKEIDSDERGGRQQ